MANTRRWMRALAAGALLLGQLSAAAPQTCEARCKQDTKDCTEVCKQNAGKYAKECTKVCTKSEKDCIKGCGK